MSLPEVPTNGKAWQVLQGDCLEVLRTLPDASVDAVVTDPPYGTGAWLRATKGAGSNGSAVHHQEPWDTWRTDWLDQAWRVVCSGVGLFCPQVHLLPLLQWIDKRPHRLCMWCRPDPRPRFGGQPAWGFDPFVVVGKVQACGGKDWFLASSPRQDRDREGREHPHQKPIAVMAWAVRLVCPLGGLVLDPFAGSGTTGVAALYLERRFLGIELDPGYFAVAEKRVRAAATGGPLFAVASTVADERTLFDSSCSNGEV